MTLTDTQTIPLLTGSSLIVAALSSSGTVAVMGQSSVAAMAVASTHQFTTNNHTVPTSAKLSTKTRVTGGGGAVSTPLPT